MGRWEGEGPTAWRGEVCLPFHVAPLNPIYSPSAQGQKQIEASSQDHSTDARIKNSMLCEKQR